MQGFPYNYICGGMPAGPAAALGRAGRAGGGPPAGLVKPAAVGGPPATTGKPLDQAQLFRSAAYTGTPAAAGGPAAAAPGRLGEKTLPPGQTLYGNPLAKKASPPSFADGHAAPAGKSGASFVQASPARKQPWTSAVQLLLENGASVQPKPDQLKELQMVGEHPAPSARGDFTVCLNRGAFGSARQPVLVYVSRDNTVLAYVVLDPKVMVAAGVEWQELASVVLGGTRAILEPLGPAEQSGQRPLAEELTAALGTLARFEGSSLLRVDSTTEGKMQARSRAGRVLVAPLTKDLARRLCTLAQRAPQAGPARAGGSDTGHGAASAPSAAQQQPAGPGPVELARLIHGIYNEGAAFPEWSIKMLEQGQLMLESTVVYYTAGSDFSKVRRVVEQREPVNIAMRRYYSEDRLQASFGYRRGAYEQSTVEELMPNVAIYCRTPMMPERGEPVNVHVINLIGFAFDNKDQPDYKYFFGGSRGLGGGMHPKKWQELVRMMTQVWLYAFECCQRKGLKYLYLTGVGGGAFSTYLPEYEVMKSESLEPVRRKYRSIVVERLPKIPDWAFTAEGRGRLENSLLVNAWDPWSMVGNGNLFDNSLDGYFGRCTAMAVLCWPRTNPRMKWEEVGVFDSAGGGHNESAGSGTQSSNATHQAAGAASRRWGGYHF